MQKGPLIILSGPSGSGKSTVVSRLLEHGDLPVRLSISATTRRPRPGEKDGVHYHFWTRERFRAAVAAGAFLEHAEVYGNFYGTLRSEVEPYREQGIAVLLEIDVQGAIQVRRQCPDAVSVFLSTSSMEVYEQRLRRRGTETEEVILKRIAAARCELEHAPEYQYQITNDALDTAVAQLRALVVRLVERGEHAG
jgi:guanylate kinase